MRLLLVFACLLPWLAACGSSEAPPPPAVSVRPDASTEERECVDNDGDGFGQYCGYPDCDDDDPEITDLCFRCAGDEPVEGCPCEPGTEPVDCMPPTIEGVKDGKRGVYICREGTRYCADGAWRECTVVGVYDEFQAY